MTSARLAHTALRAIVDLVGAGKRVGITGPSHRAICNLLDEVMTYAASEGVGLRAIQRVSEAEKCSSPAVTIADSNAEVEAALQEGSVDIVAGTAWLFAREELTDALDTLFVDEAGQVSLANMVAVSGAARNLVLLGDPQQLAQPLKGSHPAGTESSALAHVLGDAATIPADRGLLLDVSWRMHPTICEFISDIAYDGLLVAAPPCTVQAFEGGVGLRYVPVQHEGNRTRSTEEAERISPPSPATACRASTRCGSCGAFFQTLQQRYCGYTNEVTDADVRVVLTVRPTGFKVRSTRSA